MTIIMMKTQGLAARPEKDLREMELEEHKSAIVNEILIRNCGHLNHSIQ